MSEQKLPEGLAPVPMPETSKTRETKLAEMIDRWHFESFNSSRLGNDVELWNLVHGAKENLKSRLITALKEI